MCFFFPLISDGLLCLEFGGVVLVRGKTGYRVPRALQLRRIWVTEKINPFGLGI